MPLFRCPLRKVIEAEKLAVRGDGPLLDSLNILQKACRNFISAAGADSVEFKADQRLFLYHLSILREIFGTHVTKIADWFGLIIPRELSQLQPVRHERT